MVNNKPQMILIYYPVYILTILCITAIIIQIFIDACVVRSLPSKTYLSSKKDSVHLNLNSSWSCNLQKQTNFFLPSNLKDMNCAIEIKFRHVLYRRANRQDVWLPSWCPKYWTVFAIQLCSVHGFAGISVDYSVFLNGEYMQVVFIAFDSDDVNGTITIIPQEVKVIWKTYCWFQISFSTFLNFYENCYYEDYHSNNIERPLER